MKKKHKKPVAETQLEELVEQTVGQGESVEQMEYQEAKEDKVVPTLQSELTVEELRTLLHGMSELQVLAVSEKETHVILTRQSQNKFNETESFACTGAIFHPITYHKLFRTLIHLGFYISR